MDSTQVRSALTAFIRNKCGYSSTGAINPKFQNIVKVTYSTLDGHGEVDMKPFFETLPHQAVEWCGDKCKD